MATKQRYERKLRDIPELVEKLRDEQKRSRDYMAQQDGLQLHMDAEGALELELKRPSGNLSFGLMEQAHMQVAERLGIPASYYRRMLEGAGDKMLKEDRGLLVDNVNYWLLREGKKKRLVRTIDGNLRSYLSNRYRPISHLDLVTQVVQVASNMLPANSERNWALGARCFDFTLDSKRLDVCFVNPRWGVDLEKISGAMAGLVIDEAGIPQHEAFREFKPEDLDEGGLYRGRRDNGTAWLFPAMRVRNSETGHGGMEASSMMFEGACLNGSVRGIGISRIHLGRELDENELWSTDTMQKINRVIFAQVKDITLATFKPSGLLTIALKFKGLQQFEINPRKAADQIVELHGMTEEIRDEILDAYMATTQARGTLFDFQRGVTAAAHAFRIEQPAVASQLEEIGGDILERGMLALK